MGSVTVIRVGEGKVTFEVNGATNALEALKKAAIDLNGQEVRVDGETLTESTTVSAGSKVVVAPAVKGA